MPKRTGANNAWWTWALIGLLCIGVLAAVGWYMYRASAENCPPNMVCLSQGEYKSMARPAPAQVQVAIPEDTRARDMRVLHDPLYPPLNRTETPQHVALEKAVVRRDMYVPTRDSGDTYRLVGYVVNKDENRDAGGNTWKLMARQKDRHSADFYMVPANNNYDLKIKVTDDMMDGTRLRDLYTIPNELKFKSAMLNTTPYEFIEIPKTDFSSSAYI